MEPIRSRQNRKVVEAARLLRVREGHRTLLQGEKLVSEALAAGVAVERLFVGDRADSERWPGAGEVIAVTGPVMERLTPTGDRWGPVAVAVVPPASPRLERPVLTPIDVADPGNLGTMIRSAAAFGYDVVTVRGTDAWSPKVMRAAAGGHFRTHVSSGGAIPEGRQVLASVVDGGVAPSVIECDPHHVLLIGAESTGLPAELLHTVAALVTVPMESSESLNAATAASVLMYELGRHNRTGRSTARD